MVIVATVPTQMSHGGDTVPTQLSHGGNMPDTSASAAGKPGPTTPTSSRRVSIRGPPTLRGTRCGVQNSAAELSNMPTGQAQAVPIHRPGTQGRSIMINNVQTGPLLHILICYCLLLPTIRDLPKNGVSVLTPFWG